LLLAFVVLFVGVATPAAAVTEGAPPAVGEAEAVGAADVADVLTGVLLGVVVVTCAVDVFVGVAAGPRRR
jgi:hypothetical protein